MASKDKWLFWDRIQSCSSLDTNSEKGTITLLWISQKKGVFFWKCGMKMRAKPGFLATLSNGHMVTLSNTYLSLKIDAIWMKLLCWPQKVFLQCFFFVEYRWRWHPVIWYHPLVQLQLQNLFFCQLINASLSLF